jgi:predicted transcriptional regulator
MKAVLISIQPKWVEKIAKGEKTIEVRKSRPKLETPFKCYIYETKGKQVEKLDGCEIAYYGRGKVIGAFICDEIEEIPENIFTPTFTRILAESRLTDQEMIDYRNEKPVYGWRIYAVKIYDKPKELSEFKTIEKLYRVRKNTIGLKGGKPLKRPFQSWGYVEALQ